MNKLDVEYDLVFIIDCLPRRDRNRWAVSQKLIDFLAANGVNQQLASCENKKQVFEALEYITKQVEKGIKVCLHLVSHGNQYGLLIESVSERILWHELRPYLYNLNLKSSNTLIVNMTSCKGINGAKIIDPDENDYPFYGLIGCSKDLYFKVGRMINEKFYSKLIEGKNISVIIDEIQKEMRIKGVVDMLYGISSQGYRNLKQNSR